jgi:hypothetical protein
MVDATYQPKVYMTENGDKQVIASGGVVDVESGGSLKIAGTAITATAAEVNKTAGVTAGTVTASKALVVGANKNLDVLAVADLKLGAGAGTSVTATAAEINKLASSGAIVASGTAHVHVTDPTGGATADAEARTAINAILAALEAFGINLSS